MMRKKNRGARVALFGMLTALAMLMSYVESLLPLSIGIPGVKPGLANLVTVVCLYGMGFGTAALLSLLRIVLIGFSFGNMAALLYSLSGGALSILCMAAAKKSGLFGKTGVSILGGVAHNVGQLIAAAFVLENTAIFWYFPVLLAAGAVTGALVGMLAGEVLRRLPAAAPDSDSRNGA